MEKYGVDEEQPVTSKQANAVDKCPKCGAPVIKHGRLRLCPSHGSEPFEYSDEQK